MPASQCRVVFTSTIRSLDHVFYRKGDVAVGTIDPSGSFVPTNGRPSMGGLRVFKGNFRVRSSDLDVVVTPLMRL